MCGKDGGKGQDHPSFPKFQKVAETWLWWGQQVFCPKMEGIKAKLQWGAPPQDQKKKKKRSFCICKCHPWLAFSLSHFPSATLECAVLLSPIRYRTILVSVMMVVLLFGCWYLINRAAHLNRTRRQWNQCVLRGTGAIFPLQIKFYMPLSMPLLRLCLWVRPRQALLLLNSLFYSQNTTFSRGYQPKLKATVNLGDK